MLNEIRSWNLSRKLQMDCGVCCWWGFRRTFSPGAWCTGSAKPPPSTFTQNFSHKSYRQEEEGAHRRKAAACALQGSLKRIPLLFLHFYKWSKCEACTNEMKAVSVFHQSAFFGTQFHPSRIPEKSKTPTILLPRQRLSKLMKIACSIDVCIIIIRTESTSSGFWQFWWKIASGCCLQIIKRQWTV